MSSPDALESEVAPRRWPKRALIIFLVVVNLGIFGGLAVVWLAAHHVVSSVSTIPAAGLGLTEAPRSPDQPRTFLIVGSDSREDLPEELEGFGQYEGQRADVIMLVQIIPERNAVQILSLPRDLRIEVGGTAAKINGTFNDGPGAIIQAVAAATGLPIHHYIQVDFAGFAGIVDAVGGIEYEFAYPARDLKSKLSVSAGLQVLDGETALALARSRNYQEFRDGQWVYVEASDIGRTGRQQELLTALITQIDRPASVQGFSNLVDSLGGFVTTDGSLTEDDIIQLAWQMRSVTAGDIDAMTAPVEGLEEGGISYVVFREPDVYLVLAAYALGEPFSSAEIGDARIEVRNGNGVDGSAAAIAETLRAGGWEVVNVTNADRIDYEATVVIAPSGSRVLAGAIAAYLGIGSAQEGSVSAEADVVVIVGADAVEG
jgi:LCP family protein required for cell wall assembly